MIEMDNNIAKLKKKEKLKGKLEKSSYIILNKD